MFSGTLRLAYEVLLQASPKSEVSPRPSVALIFSSVFSAAETQTLAWTREELKFCAVRPWEFAPSLQILLLTDSSTHYLWRRSCGWVIWRGEPLPF